MDPVSSKLNTLFATVRLLSALTAQAVVHGLDANLAPQTQIGLELASFDRGFAVSAGRRCIGSRGRVQVIVPDKQNLYSKSDRDNAFLNSARG